MQSRILQQLSVSSNNIGNHFEVYSTESTDTDNKATLFSEILLAATTALSKDSEQSPPCSVMTGDLLPTV